MINKIEKLLDLCIQIAEKHLDKMDGAPVQPKLPLVADDVHTAAPSTVLAEEPKKTRKPRAAKTEQQAVVEKLEAEVAVEDQTRAAEGLEDQLGMDAPKEMTEEESKAKMEEESKAKMEEVTKQFVSLCKNDTPEDGKTRAIKLMRETFKVQKLGELTHAQRLEWIQHMEKGILEHK